MHEFFAKEIKIYTKVTKKALTAQTSGFSKKKRKERDSRVLGAVEKLTFDKSICCFFFRAILSK